MPYVYSPTPSSPHWPPSVCVAWWYSQGSVLSGVSSRVGVVVVVGVLAVAVSVSWGVTKAK